MSKVNKRDRKQQRKEAVNGYQPTDEQIKKFKEDYERAIYKNEYQDILSTEECFANFIDVKSEKNK